MWLIDVFVMFFKVANSLNSPSPQCYQTREKGKTVTSPEARGLNHVKPTQSLSMTEW